MAKTSVMFQNDWPKTVGGVALTSQLLTNGQTDKQTNGRVTARLYRTCMLTQVQQKGKTNCIVCCNFAWLVKH